MLPPPALPTARLFIESARWYATSGRLDRTLKALQKVARINRKSEEGAKLSMEVRETCPPPQTSQDLSPRHLRLLGQP